MSATLSTSKLGLKPALTPGVLRLVLGDQLSTSLSALEDLQPERDVVLMAEVDDEANYVAHHQQKLVLVFSAMRHFAHALRQRGIRVDYVALDDHRNDQHRPRSLAAALQQSLHRNKLRSVVCTEPSEYRVKQHLQQFTKDTGIALAMREDTRFFVSHARFAAWAEGRKSLRMEFFYRELRRETGLLMDGSEPCGGQWNFDHDNRKSLPAGVNAPPRLRFEPDAITRSVMDMVRQRFGERFGTLEEFAWPVTQEQAAQALSHFVSHLLPAFGDWQDAMKTGAPFLWHSLLSSSLNLGLLQAREVCAAAEAAYRNGSAPLNAVEGFIRQILGWREYVRGIYWLRMPAYQHSNTLQATRPLPAMYWGGKTQMRCMAQAIDDTRRHAYSHHIQRLMVTGNFALLAGIDPQQVHAWYLAVYVDAFEWVELPNTLGMALYADGGLLASKPYAASGAYINRMSDFCKGCHYDVKLKTGPRACPMNSLYWAFLIRNQSQLQGNPRMALPYRNLAAWSEEQRQAMTQQAEQFLDNELG